MSDWPVRQRRLVVDLMSSAPHQRFPDYARERVIANTPEGWETVVIDAPSISLGNGTNRASSEALDAMREAEVYYAFGIVPEMVEAASGLKWAHSAAAGVTGSITPALRASGVHFTNSAGIFAEPMADTVLGGVLHFARGLDLAVRQQAERVWDQKPFITPPLESRELNELRILVVGAGGIGSAVARRFSALGCDCTGIRRRPERGVPHGFTSVAGPDAIDALLPEHDVVVIAAPLTAETGALLDRHRLALLPEGAIVVNVARGALIDEAAMLETLNAGRLRGAMLDVFMTEPLPAASGFWAHPRVLITPHTSGVSLRRHWTRALDLFEDNWRRYRSGEPLRNVVDLDAGY